MFIPCTTVPLYITMQLTCVYLVAVLKQKQELHYLRHLRFTQTPYGELFLFISFVLLITYS